jgi:NAD(P)-dependent dehydrogenase (short-subunit alcohol dehydrogenase family)
MTDAHFLDKALINAGASDGIGREPALMLAEQGAWLSLAACNAEKLQEVAAQCRRRGGKAVVIPTNVAEQSQCKNLIERTVAAYGRIGHIYEMRPHVLLQGKIVLNLWGKYNRLLSRAAQPQCAQAAAPDDTGPYGCKNTS